MKALLSIFTFSLLFITACSDTDAGPANILSQQPYRPYTDSLSEDPKNARFYYQRGVLLYQNNQKALAETDLRQAWGLAPTEEHALSMVTLLLNNKHPDSALQFIEKALPLLPQSIALQISLARGYQQQGAFDKAAAVNNAVLQQYPASLDALLLKTEILKQQGKDKESLTVLEQAYELAPYDADLAHQLAFEYAEAKNSKVLALADSLINADVTGRHAEPYFFKGVYYENTGKPAQAISFYNQAIQHDYNYTDAYMYKGSLLYNQKQYAQALETFAFTTRVTPTFADGYYWIAKSQEALNQKEEAKQNYQRAYSLDKTLTEARDAAAKL